MLKTVAIGNDPVIEAFTQWGEAARERYFQLTGSNNLDLAAPLVDCYQNKRESLILNQVSVRRLPEAFGELVHLKHLTIEDGVLEDFPLSFEKCVNLEELHIAGNHLVTIPRVLAKLPNLRILDISDNFIVRVPPRENGDFPSLETLDLDGGLWTYGLNQANQAAIKTYSESGIKVTALTDVLRTDVSEEEGKKIRHQVEREVWEDLVSNRQLDSEKSKPEDVWDEIDGETEKSYLARMNLLRDKYQGLERSFQSEHGGYYDDQTSEEEEDPNPDYGYSE